MCVSECVCGEGERKRSGGCAVLCCAVLCCAVLCCAVLCCAVLCCAVLCCAVLCCAVLCCAVLCCAVWTLCLWCGVVCVCVCVVFFLCTLSPSKGYFGVFVKRKVANGEKKDHIMEKRRQRKAQNSYQKDLVL